MAKRSAEESQSCIACWDDLIDDNKCFFRVLDKVFFFSFLFFFH